MLSANPPIFLGLQPDSKSSISCDFFSIGSPSNQGGRDIDFPLPIKFFST